MKIIIGGTGTIGKAIVNDLSLRHDIIIAGHSPIDVHVDINDVTSIQAMYDSVTNLDGGGSFTLTSGIINRDPIRFGQLVNSAAIEMPRHLRINCVSPHCDWRIAG